MTENPTKPVPDAGNNSSGLTAPPATDKPGSATGKWLFVLFIVLAAITVTGGLFLLRELRTLESSLRAADENGRAESAAITAQINAINNAITDLRAQQEGMASSITSLYQQQPVSNEDWALAEVEFLLTLALHQLQLAVDLQSALRTLEAAALRLKDLADPDLEPVRQQLAADIEQLNAVNAVDISGLSIYLADLIDRAEKLPLKKPGADNTGEQTATTETTPEDTTRFGLQRLFSTIWSELKELVVIKHGSETRQILLPPAQEYFLYQNLRLELENARLSVIRRDTANLRTSVNLLKEWLLEYYDTDDSAVENVIETLDMMAGQELKPALPDINSSLETLRAYQRESDYSDTGRSGTGAEQP